MTNLKSTSPYSLFKPAALFAAFSMLSLCSTVSAETIISDNFTDTDGRTLGPGAMGTTEHNPYTPPSNTPPNVDLPGTPYTYNDTTIVSPITVQGDKASISANGGQSASIDISSVGGYVKPTTLTISADLTLNTLTSDGAPYNQEGLGFYSVPEFSQVFHNFLGLALNSQGALSLLGFATDNSPYVDDSVAYDNNGVTTFDVTIPHTVTYTVDTMTGEITSASLTDVNGTQTYTFAPIGFDFATDGFTNAQTTYAGFFARSGVADETAYLDNFSLTSPVAVPEPSTFALMAIGLGGVAFLARSRRGLFAFRG